METNDIRDVCSIREVEGKLGTYDTERKRKSEGRPSERAKREEGRKKERDRESDREKGKKGKVSG